MEVFAIGDSFKYNLKNHFGYNIPIENKPDSEVYQKENSKDNIQIHNFYFDTTPARYIKKIISDLGLLDPQNFVDSVAKNISLKSFGEFINYKD